MRWNSCGASNLEAFMHATNDEKRKTVELFYEAVEHKDIDILRRAVTADWEYIPSPAGAAPGPDKMIPVFADIAAAMPDMAIKILDVLIHDEKVGVRAEVTGTQSGPLMGIAATSKSVHFAIHSFHELRGDRIAKTWHLEDWLNVFRQLGEMPPGLSGSGHSR
jgi:predicted ester cyclase